MNREQHVKLADDAVTHAERLAGWAENAARERKPDAEPLAAAGALWDSIARTHLLIAAATPTADTTPEA
ncbi:hypothetical protein [Streptomyces sp. NPDC052192]|uniref:hypothetical protein n=1 Tax=Streptomyces sp. NPDC052192 TaxID=3155052 RepID=UPI0034460FBD